MMNRVRFVLKNLTRTSSSRFAAYSGVMVIIYPIGIPLLFSYLLFSKRQRIKKPVEEREEDENLFGMEFLFDSYKPQFWFFEIVVTVLRLLLTGVLGLIEPGSSTQLSVGMIMTFAAVMVGCWCRPYENEADNMLSILSYVQIFFIMLCGLVLKNQDLIQNDGFDKKNLGLVLIGVNVLVLTLAIALAILGWLRSNDEDYESSNVISMMKKGVKSAKNKSGLSKQNFCGDKVDEDADDEDEKRAIELTTTANPMAKERWVKGGEEAGIPYFIDEISKRTSWSPHGAGLD